MQIHKVNDNLSIASQPGEEDIGALAASGSALIINNRHDYEEAGQLTSKAEAKALSDAGIEYRYQPVMISTLVEADIRAFQAAVASVEGPVIAHCRCGTRSLTLWALGEVLDGRLSASEMVGLGEKFGLDLTGARAWLDKRTHLTTGTTLA